MNSSERKALKKQVAQRQLDQEIAAMPMDASQLCGLMDALDQGLEKCDHRSSLTEAYLGAQGLDLEPCLAWLRGKGGYCDCEVLANLDDFCESLKPKGPPAFVQPKPRSQAPQAPLVFRGQPLPALPKPWKAKKIKDKPCTIELRYGSGNEFWLRLVEAPLPFPATLPEQAIPYSCKLEQGSKWEGYTEEDALVLPGDWRALTVRFQKFLPVHCWIFDKQGGSYLLARSDSVRFKGDRKLLEGVLALLLR